LTNVRPGKLQGGHPNVRAEALNDDKEWNGQQYPLFSRRSLVMNFYLENNTEEKCNINLLMKKEKTL